MNYVEIDLARRFVDAINGKDLATLSELMADDHVFVDSQGRRTTDREALMTAWRRFFGMFPEYEIRIDRMLAENGTVAIFGSVSGVLGEVAGRPEDVRAGMTAAWQAHVEDGKVKLWQVYADWSVVGNQVAAFRWDHA